jgi:hypothetical protein
MSNSNPGTTYRQIRWGRVPGADHAGERNFEEVLVGEDDFEELV